MNYRGSSGTPIKNNRYLDLTNTNDVRLAVEQIEKEYKGLPFYLVGTSMGANLGMKYLGEVKNDTPVQCMVAISNPFDLKATVEALHTQWSTSIYSYYLTFSLISGLKRNLPYMDQEYMKRKGIDLSKLDQFRTTRQFDEEFTIKFHDGWKNATEYSEGMSSKDYIEHITRPCLVINSMNDPISTYILQFD